MDFHSLLARARGRLTQEDAAMAAGVHRNTLSRWENGEGIPDAGQLARLAACYGLDVEAQVALMTAAGHASEHRSAAGE